MNIFISLTPQISIFFKLFKYNHNINDSLFKINKFKGNQCNNINKYSRILPLLNEYTPENNLPC